MQLRPPRRRALRPLIAIAVVAASLGTSLTASSSGDLTTQISATRSAAASLRSQIAADTRQIDSTSGGLAQARARLAAVQATLNAREGELAKVQKSLIAARDRLVDLENRMHLATTALASNLVAGYEGNQPDIVSVILDAHGFGALLDQLSFMAKVADHNASIVGATRVARAQVSAEAVNLEGLEARDRKLALQVLSQRNAAAALQAALLHRELEEQAQRARAAGTYKQLTSHLANLRQQLNAYEQRAAAAATTGAATSNAGVGGIRIDTGGMVQPPPGAPPAVAEIIAAGNAIATLPYIYGGGHASFQADGYDCSGSVSYALAAAGLVSSPMVSGDFENWGDPGPGRWVTIYANADHVWMEVAGWRFDTVALAEDGTRWHQGGGEFSGFVVRHPPGL
jgi:peptidoglycan hydrolase CwlO-like protein